MKTLEQIHTKYSELCLILGDLQVKQRGIQNKVEEIFKELEKLDKQATLLKELEDEDRQVKSL
jgi:hypothetical protein